MKNYKLIWMFLLLIVAMIIVVLIWQDNFSFLVWNTEKVIASLLVIIFALFLSHFHGLINLLSHKVMELDFQRGDKTNIDIDNKKQKKESVTDSFWEPVKFMRHRHGLFWRYKIRKCLVIGSYTDVESVFPNLQDDKWQLCDKTLMVYGGDIEHELDTSWLLALKKRFSRCIPFAAKPLNAIIWVMPKYYLDSNRQQQVLIEKALQQIEARDKLLKWSAPLYLVAPQNSEWHQVGRIEQSVGVIFPLLNQESLQSIDTSLYQLSQECCIRGMQQVKGSITHDFLLKISQKLTKGDIEHIKRYLGMFTAFPYSPYVRGLFFVPHQVFSENEELNFDNYLVMTPTWQSISDDANAQLGKRMGIRWGMVSCIFLLGVSTLLGLGVLNSYFRNSTLINDSIKLVKNADSSIQQDLTTKLQNQFELQQRIEQLLYRKQHGAPFSYRFGLNHNNELLENLWLSYRVTNSRNIATPFHNLMTDYLTLLTELPPDSPERLKLADSAYDFLKAYLMLSHPDKSDGIYLSQFASQKWRAPEGISDGDWQRLMPDLVRFWGQVLKSKPDWALQEDKRLVNGIQKILINKIGVQNAVNTLYQDIIQRASQQYTNQNLNQLLEGIDSNILFINDVEVPGIFTRKAWEDTIKNEINSAAKSRKEQIDWVLGEDSQSNLIASISPDVLRQQLKDRYFSEYGASWAYFLNNIQWQPANNVSDVIEQLTLLADNRQSPLIALINVVKYQSEVDYSGDGLSDNLIRTAQQIIGKKNQSVIPLANNEASGPLTETFSPIVNLIKNENNNLSLQTYLSRVTQVRLKLQNVTNSADPKAMMQGLAKSVFKGTSVDLTETRDYGNLIAANLGNEWSGFGHSLFKQPLEQSWQVVLTPATESFNEIWQNYIVHQWEKSFAGRYPFKNSENEASFAELARFLRSDTGIIDNFIINELGGVLEKKGGRWVVNTVNAQGLNFSPKFINALELFNDLSSELITSGDVSLAFDLMPRSGNNIVRTELIINKQKLEYYNQAPTWQRFNWPGDGYSPYSQLSWSSDETGLKLYDYFNGDWSLIRLLEKASVKPLDSSRYELVWKVSEEGRLRYILRTQLGQGPLTLLKLRNFTLPNRVFEN
ncbi:ImcF-related family protein [Gilliamella sp. CG16]|uniref:ImcF-related family protein n=1 Tax=Gilliamella sp. CG16 TaxID=3351503 RepID=UPI003987EF58